MKRVTVRYFNIIRDLAGQQEEPLDLPDDATVATLVETVAGRHGQKLSKVMLAADGPKSPYLSVFVNQKRVQAGGLGALLADGDVVMILPAIAGGRCREGQV